MALVIHNTASGKKETFKPLRPDRIGMYLCGPTVYDYIHIGNARPLVVFDVLYRYLRYHYKEVVYVRNITDVDDKINARALEENISIQELTAKTTAQFHEDAKALNCLPPNHEPRATENIPQMIEIIEKLIEKNHAYAAEDHVLFDVKSMPNYGQFARISEEELLAGARVEKAPFKRNPQDFVLWKPSTGDLPGWKNPWNERGRPGWHIECSAMSRAYLGETFDLHLGGQDLIFPHHQNEIAQSCCAFPDEAFARYWMHNGYLLSEGEKMSKSVGNFYTVRELLEEGFSGEALRHVLLKSHYRHPLNFSRLDLSMSQSLIDMLYKTLDEYKSLKEDGDNFDDYKLAEPMLEALSNDLNTPLAVMHFYDFLDKLRKEETSEAYKIFRTGAKILGVLQGSVEEWIHGGNMDISVDEIFEKISNREKAKEMKDFATADKIRDELKKHGVELKDSPSGTEWSRNRRL